jgi:hypothetical protein
MTFIELLVYAAMAIAVLSLPAWPRRREVRR